MSVGSCLSYVWEGVNAVHWGRAACRNAHRVIGQSRVRVPTHCNFFLPPTMSTRNQVINFQTLRTLVNVDGLYLLGYAWLFGMCMFYLCLSSRCQILMVALYYSSLDYVLWGYAFEPLLQCSLIRYGFSRCNCIQSTA
jgi:hypothetical protein